MPIITAKRTSPGAKLHQGMNAADTMRGASGPDRSTTTSLLELPRSRTMRQFAPLATAIAGAFVPISALYASKWPAS